MLRRVIAGVVGGVAAALPVAAVNTASASGLLDARDTQTAMLIGTVALLSGAVLGGLVAGTWAGRRGGTGAAGVAGVLAACVYAASVVARLVGWFGPRETADPVATAASLVFVAALLIGIAMLIGRLVYRAPVSIPRAPAPPGPPRAPHSSGPYGARHTSDDRQRDPRWPDRTSPPSVPRYQPGMPSRPGAERDPRYRR
jgi:hypothetical protein